MSTGLQQPTPPPNPHSPLLLSSTSVHPRSSTTFIFNYCVALLTVTTLFLLPLTISPRFSTFQSHTSSFPTPSRHVPVSIAVLGDWGRQGQYNQRQTALALSRIVINSLTNLSPISRILSVGDNFYDHGVLSVHDPLFHLSFENVYNHPVLMPLPWHISLGNHDHRGNYRAQILYSSISSRWQFPSPYYSLSLSSTLLLLVLDTTPLSNDTSSSRARSHPSINPKAQLEWLHRQLSDASPSIRFLVMGHHNLYSASIADHHGILSVKRAIEPILFPHARRIVAYLSGHEHALMHMRPYEGSSMAHIDHFVSGAGSKLRTIVPPPPHRANFWFRCCSVLARSTNHSIPRTVWSQTVNGFFVFTIDHHTFLASAYDLNARLIYRYHKHLPPL